jgi:hypothetical protein
MRALRFQEVSRIQCKTIFLQQIPAGGTMAVVADKFAGVIATQASSGLFPC